MRPEAFDIALSFVCFVILACGIDLSIVAFRRFVLGKPWPPVSDLRLSCLITAAISVGITLVICLIFQLTGFFESQFYRPSSRDYAMAEKLGVAPEEVSLRSQDGTQLYGWWLPAEGGDDAVATVIAFHGSDRNITYTVKNTDWLTQHSMNVFVFDYRGYGKSQGRPSRNGLVEDSLAAIRYIAGRDETGMHPLVLYGQSMGGQLAITAAAEAAEPRIALVVSEATYAKHSYHLSDKLGRLGPLWLLKWGGWLLTSDRHSAESSIASLRDIPVLLIHGTADTGVSPYHSRRLRDCSVGPIELWEYAGARHLEIFSAELAQQRLADYIASIVVAEDSASTK